MLFQKKRDSGFSENIFVSAPNGMWTFALFVDTGMGLIYNIEVFLATKKTKKFRLKISREGFIKAWKWHFNPRTDNVPKFTGSDKEWKQNQVETFYKEGAQGAEKSYRHKTKSYIVVLEAACLLSRPHCLYFGKYRIWNSMVGNQDALNRSYSLKKNKSFRYVYRRGKTIVHDGLSICYVMKKTPGLNVGFSVSKKIGNAVVRNRVKRRLKEAFSQYLDDLKPNTLMIIVARPGIQESDFAGVRKNVERILRKAKLFKEEGWKSRDEKNLRLSNRFL